MRPLWFEVPEDPAHFETDDEFLLGPALLVAPVMEEGASQRAVYLPPAGQGDVFRAVRDRRPAVVALIDGVFLDGAAVWQVIVHDTQPHVLKFRYAGRISRRSDLRRD